MNIKNFTNLRKVLDDFECTLTCSSNCPVDFILHCLEEFKVYCTKIKEDSSKQEEPGV